MNPWNYLYAFFRMAKSSSSSVLIDGNFGDGPYVKLQTDLQKPFAEIIRQHSTVFQTSFSLSPCNKNISVKNFFRGWQLINHNF